MARKKKIVNSTKYALGNTSVQSTSEIVRIKVTKSMLSKANIDANIDLREKLRIWKIIDYDSIKKGISNKLVIKINLSIENFIEVRNMSCYHTKNRGFRFWIERLSSSIHEDTFLEFSLNDKSELFIKADQKINLKHGKIWSDDELELCAKEYINYRDSKKENKTKASIYRKLSISGATKGRSVKSIEYRFLNISSVLKDMGEEIIIGLLPKSNVGKDVHVRLTNILKKLI